MEVHVLFFVMCPNAPGLFNHKRLTGPDGRKKIFHMDVV